MMPALLALLLTLAAPSQQALRNCGASDLRSVGGMLQGATGNMLGRIPFRNVSSTPCRLGGRPRARIFTLKGRLLRTRELTMSSREIGMVPLRTLGRGRRADLYLFWSEWCGSWPQGVVERTLRLRLTLTTGVHLTVRFQSGRPRCDVRTGSTLAVSAFGRSR